MCISLKKILIINLIAFAFINSGCEEQSQKKDYVARVDNSILTKEGLENYLSQEKFKNKFKNEFIRQWVHEEILYKEAVEIGLTQTNEYIDLLNIAEKQVAISMLLKKHFNNNEPNYTEYELSNFYNSYKENFRVANRAYILNMIEFTNVQDAVKFRFDVIQNTWRNALNNILNDTNVVFRSLEKLYYEHDLNPLKMLRTVSNLRTGEVSIVINKEPGIFTVVQLVKIIDKNDILEFRYVKDEIREMHFAQKQKEFYNRLIESLFSKYHVEIKKVDE